MLHHTNGTSAQALLFQRIREQLPEQVSLADTVSEKLHVSTDSAYRRIRGETPLVLDEAKVLCSAFDISLDEVFAHEKKNDITFRIFSAGAGNGFEVFLHTLLQQLRFIAAGEQKEIIYLTKDIPIFHQFSYRPLFAFRLFFWMKSILQLPAYVHRRFSLDSIPPQIEQLGNDIMKVYNDIPTTEIWNSECISSVLAQIEYYAEAGFFASPHEMEVVYEALADTVQHLRAQAEHGCKYRPGENPALRNPNFQFYFNRVVLGDNTILVLRDGKKMVYLNHDVLNYMMTTDAAFADDVHEKLKNLMRRSTIISQASEKQRSQFFNSLVRQVRTAMQHTLKVYSK